MESLSPMGNQVRGGWSIGPEAETHDRSSEVFGLQHVDGSSDARRAMPRGSRPGAMPECGGTGA